jgi:hypothetical protein
MESQARGKMDCCAESNRRCPRQQAPLEAYASARDAGRAPEASSLMSPIERQQGSPKM